MEGEHHENYVSPSRSDKLLRWRAEIEIQSVAEGVGLSAGTYLHSKRNGGIGSSIRTGEP